MKAHAYITYNVKIKSSQRKILLSNNAEFIEKKALNQEKIMVNKLPIY